MRSLLVAAAGPEGDSGTRCDIRRVVACAPAESQPMRARVPVLVRAQARPSPRSPRKLTRIRSQPKGRYEATCINHSALDRSANGWRWGKSGKDPGHRLVAGSRRTQAKAIGLSTQGDRHQNRCVFNGDNTVDDVTRQIDQLASLQDPAFAVQRDIDSSLQALNRYLASHFVWW